MNTTCSTLPTPRVRIRGAARARRNGEAVLRSNDREAAVLAGRLIAAQESERHRIARDLHDNLGQKLSLLCMEIEGLGAQAGEVSPALAEGLARLSERARDIGRDVHCLSHDLHPPKLELLGLRRPSQVSAMTWPVNIAFESSSGKVREATVSRPTQRFVCSA